MGSTTVITCDIKGCNSRLEIKEGYVDGAEELIQITLADGTVKFFCCVEHCRQWVNGYTCNIPKGNSN